MADFIDSKRVKARKEYKCHLCSKDIEKGEYHVIHSGRWEGEWFSHRLHETCDEYISDYINDSGDPEYTQEFVEEFLFEKYCLDCPFLNEEDDCDIGMNIFRCDNIMQIYNCGGKK